MNYRTFGSTNVKVSEVGMGCWAIGGNEFGNSYGPTDDALSIQTIKKALDLGCTFFDTADVYGHGHSEELLGFVLPKVREKVFIATKVGYDVSTNSKNFSEEYIRSALEKSLLRLKTTYVDLYQLHSPSIHEIKKGEVFNILRDFQKEGKIKYIGVSVHTLDEGIAALDKVDSIQCVFNMLDPRNYELIEAAKVKGIAVIAREPLCNGFLTGKITPETVFEKGDIRYSMPPAYKENLISSAEQLRNIFSHRKEPLSQLALKYVLASKAVSVVIPGAKTPHQVEQNLHTSDIPELTEKDLELLGS
ncbi:MAG TPA: aldo/keto reductase [archaeon]|nr:aldo/keto reductase [archaeon]